LAGPLVKRLSRSCAPRPSSGSDSVCVDVAPRMCSFRRCSLCSVAADCSLSSLAAPAFGSLGTCAGGGTVTSGERKQPRLLAAIDRVAVLTCWLLCVRCLLIATFCSLFACCSGASCRYDCNSGFTLSGPDPTCSNGAMLFAAQQTCIGGEHCVLIGCTS
jgi:hypothetical protein